MKLSISLAPDGGLRVHLPGNRSLDVGCTPSSLGFIQRILRDVSEGKRDQRGYIGEFPTQHIIDIWKKQDEQRKMEASIARMQEMGIDLDKLDISL